MAAGLHAQGSIQTLFHCDCTVWWVVLNCPRAEISGWCYPLFFFLAMWPPNGCLHRNSCPHWTRDAGKSLYIANTWWILRSTATCFYHDSHIICSNSQCVPDTDCYQILHRQVYYSKWLNKLVLPLLPRYNLNIYADQIIQLLYIAWATDFEDVYKRQNI